MTPRRAPIHSPPTRRQRHRPNQSAALGARRTDERASQKLAFRSMSACIRWVREAWSKRYFVSEFVCRLRQRLLLRLIDVDAYGLQRLAEFCLVDVPCGLEVGVEHFP